MDARDFGSSRDGFKVSAWRVIIETDRFTGMKRCRLALRSGRAAYGNGAITFAVPKHIDLTEAMVKIDDDAPALWRDLVPELPGSLGNSLSLIADKRVPVPARLIEGAKRIAIVPGFGKRPRVFEVTGFERARQSAVETGCGSDTAFVR